jgi:hypothetical protein
MVDIQYKETFFNVNLKQWLNINMNMKLGFDCMKQWTEYWATTCHCLWYWRNKMMHESDSVVLITLPWLDVMRRVQRIRLVIRLLNTSSGSLLMWGGLFNSTRMAHLRKERWQGVEDR